jgi:hypothetical protein
LKQFRDRRIAVRPIGFDFHNAMTLKGVAHFGIFQHSFLIELAGQTPGRGEIDKDNVAGIALRL